VIYGFDTAGSLGEETLNPTREAPRGVLWSLGLSFVAGVIFLGAALVAIKNVPAIMKSTTPLPDIITGNLGHFWGNVYLLVVSVAIFVCTLSIQAAGIRLMFSMGRDGRLPFSNLWAAVHPTFRTPMWTGIATGVLAALPLLVSTQLPVIVVGATGLIYLSYFLTNVVVLQARWRGWPERPAWFNLGRWSLPINVLALVYGGSMLINFAWFRPLTNPTIGSAFTGIANWFIIGGTPIFELLVAVLLIVGALYWFAVQRHKVVPQQVPPTAERGGEAGMRPAR
jgi:amino acid transporter